MDIAAVCPTAAAAALHRPGGRTIEPADFRGQKLVIFFCPSEPAAAAREIEAFRALAADFADAGAWLVGVIEGWVRRPRQKARRKSLS